VTTGIALHGDARDKGRPLPSTYLPTARVVGDSPHPRDLSDLLHKPGLLDRAGAVAGLAITIVVLIGVAMAAGRVRMHELFASMPTSPGFWLLLGAGYVLAPALDWMILRRLWRLPAAGFVPLLRKQVANEILLGYSGDAQFYLWARNNLPLQAAPFATLRDMSILSALAGNLATLMLMAVAYPALSRIAGGPLMHGAVLSKLAIVVTSLGIFVARHALFTFSFSRRAIVGVFLGHMARIAAMLIVNALLWLALIPGATFGTLLVLATMRMMLSRVPLVPGKDALFAGAALALLGSDAKVAGAVAIIAGLTIGLHALVGTATAAEDVLRRWRR
jgi:hypothetical protein